MSKYNESLGTGKLGVNLIKNIVDQNKCYFHEIKQENDVGIDAFIEFTKNGENDGKCIAIQIKNGKSFFNKQKTYCYIPVDGHYNYWENHSLDVYGIVCDSERNKAYWVSITNFVKTHNSNIKIIKFPIMKINELNKNSFNNIFKQMVYNNLPILTYEKAMNLTNSNFEIEIILAIKILVNNYCNKKQTWDKCFEFLINENNPTIQSLIVYYLSYVPRHPDLMSDLKWNTHIKNYVKNKILQFNENVVIKMLKLIDDDGIGRGTIGQCVESIIKLLPNNIKMLNNILNISKDKNVRLCAFEILCYYNYQYILNHKKYYIDILGEDIIETIKYIEKYKFFDFYC